MNRPDWSVPGIHAFFDGEPLACNAAVVHTTICGTCNGKGVATYSRSINSPFAGDLFRDDCWQCDGQGSLENETCRCDECKAALARMAAAERGAA